MIMRAIHGYAIGVKALTGAVIKRITLNTMKRNERMDSPLLEEYSGEYLRRIFAMG